MMGVIQISLPTTKPNFLRNPIQNNNNSRLVDKVIAQKMLPINSVSCITILMINSMVGHTINNFYLNNQNNNHTVRLTNPEHISNREAIRQYQLTQPNCRLGK